MQPLLNLNIKLIGWNPSTPVHISTLTKRLKTDDSTNNKFCRWSCIKNPIYKPILQIEWDEHGLFEQYISSGGHLLWHILYI